MDYHQNARLTIHSREQLAKRVLEQGWTLKQAAACFNVCSKTASKWVNRYREHGLAGMRDHSSRPHRSPRRTPRPNLTSAASASSFNGNIRLSDLVLLSEAHTSKR